MGATTCDVKISHQTVNVSVVGSCIHQLFRNENMWL